MLPLFEELGDPFARELRQDIGSYYFKKIEQSINTERLISVTGLESGNAAILQYRKIFINEKIPDEKNSSEIFLWYKKVPLTML